jgi:hypothetical protein
MSILWRFYRPIDLLRDPPKPGKPKKRVKNRVFSPFSGCPHKNLPQKVGKTQKPCPEPKNVKNWPPKRPKRGYTPISVGFWRVPRGCKMLYLLIYLTIFRW